MAKRLWTILILIGAFSSAAFTQDEPKKTYQEFSLDLYSDYRYFFNEGLYPGQKQNYYSLAITPEYLLEWKDGEHSLRFTGFFRWETHDTRRTHGDIRELYWQWVKGNAELSVGAKKIFWGVTESAHLVDIVNQTDAVESFDGEQKLGQPMVHFSYYTNFGTVDLFAMTYFRRRQFPGREGRLRPPLVLEKDEALYQSDLERWQPDFAIRWSNSIGPFDMGVSHFYGTGREPIFMPSANGFELIYPLTHQTGVDLLAVTGPAIWKAEGVVRANDFQTLWLFAGGVEYTFGNIFSSGIDIGVLAEYLYDNRDELSLTGLDNDLFVGSRIAFNDAQSTEILFGGIIDLGRSTRLYSVEASRRFGSSWKLELETRIFSNVSQEEFLSLFQEDSFLQFRIAKFF